MIIDTTEPYIQDAKSIFTITPEKEDLEYFYLLFNEVSYPSPALVEAWNIYNLYTVLLNKLDKLKEILTLDTLIHMHTWILKNFFAHQKRDISMFYSLCELAYISKKKGYSMKSKFIQSKMKLIYDSSTYNEKLKIQPFNLYSFKSQILLCKKKVQLILTPHDKNEELGFEIIHLFLDTFNIDIRNVAALEINKDKSKIITLSFP